MDCLSREGAGGSIIFLVPPFAFSTPARSGLLLPKGRSLHNENVRSHFLSGAFFCPRTLTFASCPADRESFSKPSRGGKKFAGPRKRDPAILFTSAPSTPPHLLKLIDLPDPFPVIPGLTGNPMRTEVHCHVPLCAFWPEKCNWRAHDCPSMLTFDRESLFA